jgi:polyphosphate glucokinase
MKVLAIDVGGMHVKRLTTDQETPQQFVSGPKLTAKRMVATAKKLARGWDYDAVSIGYPGPVLHPPRTA